MLNNYSFIIGTNSETLTERHHLEKQNYILHDKNMFCKITIIHNVFLWK
jgi:hypothetical protein